MLWTLLSKGAASNPYFVQGAPMGAGHIAWRELQTWSQYLDQMIGVFSWLDARMPEFGYIIWPIVGGALVFWAYVLTGRSGRRRLVALALAGVLAPLSITVALANKFGFITQGRYLLPLLVGLPILATFLIAEDRPTARQSASVRRLTSVLLLPIQIAGLVFTMQRWQLGQGPGAGFNLWHAPWQPPLGPTVPLVAGIVGVGLLGGLVAGRRRSTADPSGPAASERSSRWLHRDAIGDRKRDHGAIVTGTTGTPGGEVTLR
jgi:hypothetical protein